MTARVTRSLASFASVVLILLLVALIHTASAQTTTITAYKSQAPVNVHAPYQASQWTDTPTTTDTTSGVTFAVKQNGTGLLFSMIWSQSTPYCVDASCFGGIELGNVSNTLPMGSPSAPTMMILASTSFKNNVDEFLSIGTTTPLTVESKGYSTQSVCGLTFSGTQYTAVCYRPFALTNASPYDFPNLGTGSSVEIGFAVGEFSQPGTHLASNMQTYVLTISSQTYGTIATSSSGTQSTSSATQSSSSPPAAPAPPSVLDYVIELLVIVVGFTFFILIVMLRYQRS